MEAAVKEKKKRHPVMISDFPEELRQELKIRAAVENVPLQILMARYCREGLQRAKPTGRG